MYVCVLHHHASCTTSKGGYKCAEYFNDKCLPIEFHSFGMRGIARWVFLTIGKGTKKVWNGARAEFERRGNGGVTGRLQIFLHFNKKWGETQ